MKIPCFWEHNRGDTLLYAVDLPGAFTRGESLSVAITKMPAEIKSYLAWKGDPVPDLIEIVIAEEKESELDIRDADSDAIFDREKAPLTREEYEMLKSLALRSAKDLLALYESISDKDAGLSPLRKTFYGQVPHTAREMYAHTKSVNAYYFGEIGIIKIAAKHSLIPIGIIVELVFEKVAAFHKGFGIFIVKRRANEFYSIFCFKHK